MIILKHVLQRNLIPHQIKWHRPKDKNLLKKIKKNVEYITKHCYINNNKIKQNKST